MEPKIIQTPQFRSPAMLCEPGTDGKPSSRRWGGWVCLLVGLGMSVMSGFDCYNPETSLIMTIFGTATALLGLTAFGKRNHPKHDNNESHT